MACIPPALEKRHQTTGLTPFEEEELAHAREIRRQAGLSFDANALEEAEWGKLSRQIYRRCTYFLAAAAAGCVLVFVESSHLPVAIVSGAGWVFTGDLIATAIVLVRTGFTRGSRSKVTPVLTELPPFRRSDAKPDTPIRTKRRKPAAAKGLAKPVRRPTFDGDTPRKNGGHA
jgi:hypothetical protein